MMLRYSTPEKQEKLSFIKPESLPSEFYPYDTSAKTPDAATVLGWVKTN